MHVPSCTIHFVLVLLFIKASYQQQGHTSRPHPPDGSQTFTAFSAGLTHTVKLSNQSASALVLDRVFLNLNSAYDVNTGRFTAPHDGVFSFMFYALTQYNKHLQINLFRNSNYIITGYSHIANDYGTSSNNIVLSLSKGDQVYLMAKSDSYLYGTPEEVYTTFSGFLLYV